MSKKGHSQLMFQENMKLCSYLVVSFNFEMKWLLQYVTLWKKFVLILWWVSVCQHSKNLTRSSLP